MSPTGDDEDMGTLERVVLIVADLQRRVENLERYTCGGREQVEEASKKILVKPFFKRAR